MVLRRYWLQSIRGIGIGSVVIALGVADLAAGAGWSRLFGPARGASGDHEPEKTYYQPPELRKMRPTQAALPIADFEPDSKASIDEKISDSKLSKMNETSRVAVIGDPLATSKLAMMSGEIAEAIRARGLEAEFARWTSYMAAQIDKSAGKTTGSELTGNCRLKWYDRMMRRPTSAPAVAERFTRELHQAVFGKSPGYADLLRIVRQKLDAAPRDLPPPPEVGSSAQALEVLQQVLERVRADYTAALAALTKPEIDELASRVYPVFLGGNSVGHTLNNRASARRLCDLMEKIDRGAMLAAAENLLPLLTEDFRQHLEEIPAEGNVTVPGVSGRVLKKIPTAAGAIIVGARGKNVYRLNEMPDVAVVIDLGGDDEYIEGSVSLQRPVLAIVDLKGNDRYRGTRPGIQGGAILGVSLLLDWEGNDVYDAGDVAQGSSLAGIGILIDHSGNDTYRAQRRAQAHAIAGLGLLIDRAGNDDYRSAMWGQGFGGPLGLGLLDDVRGDDHYFLGGVYPDSYPETPGLEGWGQGVGAGIRQVANGGIGVLLDGAGDDVYEFDYLSHGGGYWLGLGFLRDFAGNDKHLGSTEKSYAGGTRSQPAFQRFGCGWGCHFAMGFCFDDAGDDVYRGWIMGMGFGWDCSLALLADFGGKDRYEANGAQIQGNGAQGSMGLLYDCGDHDSYTGSSQGYASPSMSYHPLPACGGNFSFLIDYGDKDDYGCNASNDAITQRGWAGGFLIDRSCGGAPDDGKPAESKTTGAAYE